MRVVIYVTVLLPAMAKPQPKYGRRVSSNKLSDPVMDAENNRDKKGRYMNAANSLDNDDSFVGEEDGVIYTDRKGFPGAPVYFSNRMMRTRRAALAARAQRDGNRYDDNKDVPEPVEVKRGNQTVTYYNRNKNERNDDFPYPPPKYGRRAERQDSDVDSIPLRKRVAEPKYNPERDDPKPGQKKAVAQKYGVVEVGRQPLPGEVEADTPPLRGAKNGPTRPAHEDSDMSTKRQAPKPRPKYVQPTPSSNEPQNKSQAQKKQADQPPPPPAAVGKSYDIVKANDKGSGPQQRNILQSQRYQSEDLDKSGKPQPNNGLIAPEAEKRDARGRPPPQQNGVKDRYEPVVAEKNGKGGKTDQAPNRAAPNKGPKPKYPGGAEDKSPTQKYPPIREEEEKKDRGREGPGARKSLSDNKQPNNGAAGNQLPAVNRGRKQEPQQNAANNGKPGPAPRNNSKNPPPQPSQDNPTRPARPTNHPGARRGHGAEESQSPPRKPKQAFHKSEEPDILVVDHGGKQFIRIVEHPSKTRSGGDKNHKQQQQQRGRGGDRPLSDPGQPANQDDEYVGVVT